MHPIRPWPLCKVQDGPHLAALCTQCIHSLLHECHVLSAQWLLDTQCIVIINVCFLIDLYTCVTVPHVIEHF